MSPGENRCLGLHRGMGYRCGSFLFHGTRVPKGAFRFFNSREVLICLLIHGILQKILHMVIACALDISSAVSERLPYWGTVLYWLGLCCTRESHTVQKEVLSYRRECCRTEVCIDGKKLRKIDKNH